MVTGTSVLPRMWNGQILPPRHELILLMNNTGHQTPPSLSGITLTVIVSFFSHHEYGSKNRNTVCGNLIGNNLKALGEMPLWLRRLASSDSSWSTELPVQVALWVMSTRKRNAWI